MNTIFNLLDADDSLLERTLAEEDVVEVMNLYVGAWMTVNEQLFRLEMIERGKFDKRVGQVNEIYLKIPSN